MLTHVRKYNLHIFYSKCQNGGKELDKSIVHLSKTEKFSTFTFIDRVFHLLQENEFAFPQRNLNPGRTV